MSNKLLISFDYAIKYPLEGNDDYSIMKEFILATLSAKGYNDMKSHV